jgi:hypothetical protein
MQGKHAGVRGRSRCYHRLGAKREACPATAVAIVIQVENNNAAMTTTTTVMFVRLSMIDSYDSAYCLAIESNEFVHYGTKLKSNSTPPCLRKA